MKDILDDLIVRKPERFKFLVETKHWNKLIAVIKNHKQEIQKLRKQLQSNTKQEGKI